MSGLRMLAIVRAKLRKAAVTGTGLAVGVDKSKAMLRVKLCKE